MNVFTIGFTRKSASRFFGLLRSSGARRIVDVRLNNVSQLAGFAKRDDLAYFLAELCGMQYVHLPELAPTKEMLDDYRSDAAIGRPTRPGSSTSCASGGSTRRSRRKPLRTAACCAAKINPTTATAGWWRSI